MGYLTEIFNRVLLQGVKSLAPTYPPDQTTNIVYQPVSINGCFQPLWQVFGSCFQFLYLLLSANDLRVLLWPGEQKSTELKTAAMQ